MVYAILEMEIKMRHKDKIIDSTEKIISRYNPEKDFNADCPVTWVEMELIKDILLLSKSILELENELAIIKTKLFGEQNEI